MDKKRRKDAKPAYDALMKVYPFTLEDLPDEEWLPIPGYNGYQESNYGRTKSFRKGKRPRILKPAINSNGYLHLQLSKDGTVKNFLVNRLVAICFVPNPEGKTAINHRDGNKLNNHVANLEWCTLSENQKHAVATGLKKSGEDCSWSKLTNQQVRYIRDNPDNLSQQKLGEMFGVKQTQIGLIQRGKRYKTAGGVIRDKIDRRLSDELREQIRTEYVYGSREFGSYALGKKYGVSPVTIINIIHEQR